MSQLVGQTVTVKWPSILLMTLLTNTKELISTSEESYNHHRHMEVSAKTILVSQPGLMGGLLRIHNERTGLLLLKEKISV